MDIFKDLKAEELDDGHQADFAAVTPEFHFGFQEHKLKSFRRANMFISQMLQAILFA